MHMPFPTHKHPQAHEHTGRKKIKRKEGERSEGEIKAQRAPVRFFFSAELSRAGVRLSLYHVV